MTHQRDPDRSVLRRLRWSPVTLVLGVLLVLVAGWALLASRAGPGTPTTTTSSDRPTDPNMTLKQPGN